MLNNIQRCSAKFLQLHEEKECCDIDTNLQLFSAFIYFSSPTQRTKFRKDIEKYMHKCKTFESLSILKRVLSYVKISDRVICQQYWDVAVSLVNKTTNLHDIVRLCQHYITFSTDIANFRHFKFEKAAIEYIRHALHNKELINALGLTIFLSFCLKSGANDALVTNLIDKMWDNMYHMMPYHYILLANGIEDIQNSSVSKTNLKRIKQFTGALQAKLLQLENHSFSQHVLLTKAFIKQGDVDSYTFETLLYKFKEMEFMSSKLLENLCNIFQITGSIVPEVLNKCTEYVVNNPKNVIGFNAERLLFVCYFLAYYPLNDDTFFKLATDIILR